MVSTKLIANAGSAAEFLMLMGNEKRLLIMSYLIDGEMSVGAIAEKVMLSQSALSASGQVAGARPRRHRRDRQMIYYFCKSDAVRELLGMLPAFSRGKEDQSQMAPFARRNLTAYSH